MTLLPKVKLKAAVNFPATVRDGTGIDVVKSNGSYQFNLDYGDFAPSVTTISDVASQNALIWNETTDAYTLAKITAISSETIFTQLLITDLTQTPEERFGTGTQYGSVGDGAIYVETVRTGGSGNYGNVLVLHTVSAALRVNEFDSGITSWVTAQNMTMSSSQVFGGWFGSNTPASYLGHTYTAGAAIGAEVNAGNRWGNTGLQLDVGGTRYTVGLQVVPDVLPASDGENLTAVTISVASPAVVTLTSHGYIANMGVRFSGAGTLPTGLVAGTVYYVSATGLAADTFQISSTIGGASINTTGSFAAPISVLPSYPGSFGLAISKSVQGHQWWVGNLIRTDTICAGGHAHIINGGSVAASAPLDAIFFQGRFTNGIDLSQATFTTAIKLSQLQSIVFGATTIAGGASGALGLSTGGTAEGTLYGNNFAQPALRWVSNGSVAGLGFFGVAAGVQPASYGTPTSVSKTASLPGTASTLAQVGGTLAALIADLKNIGLLGA